MNKFNVGDVVCRNPSVGYDETYRVVFNTTISDVNYCGLTRYRMHMHAEDVDSYEEVA